LAARRLITGRSGNIGLLVPDLSNPFFADIAKGVQQSMRERNGALFISDSDEQVRYELPAVRQLSRQVDGIIMCSPRMSDEALLDLAESTKMVLLYRTVGAVPAVVADWADGMRQAVANLHALGHRSIAYAAGPPASWSGARRLEGLHAAADALGVDLIELGSVAPTFDGGLVAADLLMATPATALIGYNDQVVLGVLSRLHARGVRVPQQMSLIGCDNVRMAAMSSPLLTTVAVPRAEAGVEAVAMLDRVLAGEDPASLPVTVLPTHLVVRDTTDVPGR
jgi:DNA-binding LacI/PurR family transcriptional regulator